MQLKNVRWERVCSDERNSGNLAWAIRDAAKKSGNRLHDSSALIPAAWCRKNRCNNVRKWFYIPILWNYQDTLFRPSSGDCFIPCQSSHFHVKYSSVISVHIGHAERLILALIIALYVRVFSSGHSFHYFWKRPYRSSPLGIPCSRQPTSSLSALYSRPMWKKMMTKCPLGCPSIEDGVTHCTNRWPKHIEITVQFSLCLSRAVCVLLHMTLKGLEQFH